MPTQFSRLLRPPAPGQADPLVDKLKRHDPDAEREIARRYNRKTADRSRTIPEPLKGGPYDSYDPNHPSRDDLTLALDLGAPAGVVSSSGEPFRGFFHTPYRRAALNPPAPPRI
jgi:hypothetical protein